MNDKTIKFLAITAAVVVILICSLVAFSNIRVAERVKREAELQRTERLAEKEAQKTLRSKRRGETLKDIVPWSKK